MWDHTAANLEAGERRGDVFVMPERYHAGVQGPYFKDRFVYNTATISYICPQGQRLPAHIGVALPALTQV